MLTKPKMNAEDSAEMTELKKYLTEIVNQLNKALFARKNEIIKKILPYNSVENISESGIYLGDNTNSRFKSLPESVKGEFFLVVFAGEKDYIHLLINIRTNETGLYCRSINSGRLGVWKNIY